MVRPRLGCSVLSLGSRCLLILFLLLVAPGVHGMPLILDDSILPSVFSSPTETGSPGETENGGIRSIVDGSKESEFDTYDPVTPREPGVVAEPIPEPSTFWLFGAGLLLLGGGVGRKLLRSS